MEGHMWELSIPLHEPFVNAAVTVEERRVVIISICGDGTVGWGEAAPYPGITPDTADDAWSTLQRGSVLSPSAAAALGEAEADLQARRDGRPLSENIGGSLRSIATSVALGLGDDPVQRVEATGAAAVKLKIRPGNDVARVAAVREALPNTPVGVDANGSYRWEDRGALLELDGFGVDYIEQPFAADDLASHARLRDEMVAPIALDEPIDSATAAIRAIEAGACDLVVVKPSRVGLAASRAIHDIALAAGLRIKASGLLETEIGRASTLAVATLPAASHSDIAPSSWYMAGGIGGTEPDSTSGSITPPNHPGIGFTPDPEAFAPYVVREGAISQTIWQRR
jgi:O-succinylbenzoate synthase